MPGPTLTSYPPATVERLIDSVLAVLRTDPTIVATGTLILAPEGDRKDLPPAMPGPDRLPAIRLMPNVQVVGDWATESSHRLGVTVPLELIHLGTHYADTMRMGEALLRAIFPLDDGRRDEVLTALHCNHQLGINSCKVATVASEERPVGADQFATATACGLVFEIEINT